MHYEKDYDYTPINFKTILVGLCIILLAIILIAPIFKEPVKVVEPVIKLEAIQIEYVTVLVTPEPDGVNYFSSEYSTGVRKILRPFSFIREKALGYQTLVIHAVVYDYKEFNSMNWFNAADYKYYKEFPINPDNKYVVVFYNIYADDIMGDDTRFWIPTENQFLLQIGDISYQPIEYPKHLRFKELEDTYNYNDNSRVTSYNSIRSYSRSGNYTKTAGEYSQSIDILKAGKSNAIDGYMIYEVPKDSDMSYAIAYVNFFSFGTSGWRLKP